MAMNPAVSRHLRSSIFGVPPRPDSEVFPPEISLLRPPPNNPALLSINPLIRFHGPAANREICQIREQTPENLKLETECPQKTIPTGLCPKAQGWRMSAYLGWPVKNENNANGVVADIVRNEPMNGHNRVAVENIWWETDPGLLLRRNPWALGRNPVRILRGVNAPLNRAPRFNWHSKTDADEVMPTAPRREMTGQH